MQFKLYDWTYSMFILVLVYGYNAISSCNMFLFDKLQLIMFSYCIGKGHCQQRLDSQPVFSLVWKDIYKPNRSTLNVEFIYKCLLICIYVLQWQIVIVKQGLPHIEAWVLYIRTSVILDHKTNWIKMYTLSESWINNLYIDVWFVRIRHYLAEIQLFVNLESKGANKSKDWEIEKLSKLKSLAMHITNQKFSFDIFTVGNLQNILMLFN